MSTPGPTAVTSALDACQGALAAEYAAAFGYGSLGPHLTDAGQAALARSCEQAHRELATATAEQLVAAGADPAEPAADYPLPFALTDAAAAQHLALRLETAAASAWRFAISIPGAPSSLRAAAQAGLTDSAVRAVRWRLVLTPGAPSVPFPGIG